jgi:eukaryotic-like serine/threonine-protein kinase
MANQPESAAELFEAALALQPAEREVFLNKACGHDPALRQIVLDLLAEDARAGSFLQHPAFDFLDRAMKGSDSSAETIAVGDGNGSLPAQEPMRSFLPGQVLIDRFVIVRFIAKGGMGEVYEAEDSFLQGVHVALKTILPRVADEPALQNRFEREVMLAREVVHPNLCPIYDIFRYDQPQSSFLFLTMKLLPGETLAARLERQARISSEEGLAILKQTAFGLAAIHAVGIVHRDIKPNNIMLDGTGADVRLWITDFGLARALESDTTFSGRGAVAGTPSYIAPELHQGHAPSQASDLYAFGVVMHEVFTGQRPSVAPDNSSVLVNPRLSSSGVPSFCAHLIRECLELDPSRRCKAFEQALDSLGAKRRMSRPWTRRKFIGVGAAGVCAVAVGGWIERDEIYDLLHPLPGKRFVALLNWPKTSDEKVTPMLTGVLTAIKSEFARLEAFDRNLFVISPEDVGENLAAGSHLKEVCDPLGANLALAASGITGSKQFELILRLLEPTPNQVLREKTLVCATAEVTTLPARAVRAAASLLNLSQYLKSNEQLKPETESTAAFTAFQQAETLRKQLNDTGLDAAIEKYKDSVDLDPHYAPAYAKLALAYIHLYGIRQDTEALDLARANYERALALDPDLVDGYLAQAWVFELTGKEQSALDAFVKALEIDPSNPKTLVWQAELYTRLNRWADAEQTFNRALQERPNDWVTYNQLGYALDRQGKYYEAIQKFREATVAAPGSSWAFGNLGSELLQVGNFVDATESLKKSLALKPSDLGAATTSLALRYQGKYEEALPFAQEAVHLNPNDDANWLELGDCYSSMPNRLTEAKSAYMRAEKEAERHLQTDEADGPSWMLLALYKVKIGDSKEVLSLIHKAELLGAIDMQSQLYKARTLELIGRRDDALTTLAACFSKGATALQVIPFPDLQSLRRDPRYLEILHLNSPKTNNR